MVKIAAHDMNVSNKKELNIDVLQENYTLFWLNHIEFLWKISRIRETKDLSTDADNRTDTILESLPDLCQKKKIKINK